MERSHSRFSPSSAERFSVCPGSIALLERTPPRPDTEYVIEGNKAHAILDVALRNRIRSAMQAHKEYCDMPLRDEMFDADFYASINICLTHVYGILGEYPDAELYTEIKVRVPSDVAPGEADGWCDILIWVPSLGILHVIDYKHGAGIVKAVVGNMQVMQYGLGAVWGEGSPVDPTKINKVVLTIVQPRAYHEDGYIREYPITPYELYEHQEVLDGWIRACQDPKAPLVPGPHCSNTFCDARTTCPAREAQAVAPLKAAGKAIMEITRRDLPDVKGMDIQRLTHIFYASDMIERFLKDVRNQIWELQKAGVHVPGTKLVQAQGRRHYYHNDNVTAFKLAALVGVPVEDIVQFSLPGITEAERMVIEAYKRSAGRGKKKQAAEDAKRAFAFLTEFKASNTIVLVSDDDPRPAIGTTAFAQIEGVVQPPQTAETEE